MADQETVSISEAAERLGVSVGAVTNAITRGTLRAAPEPEGGGRRPGRHSRGVYRTDVESLREKRLTRLQRAIALLEAQSDVPGSDA